MCGICGSIGGRGVLEEHVTRMRDLLAHRGPDDAGTWIAADNSAALGHRRLSIIDLSHDSHQPMVQGPLAIVYNGELYNYRELRDELRARGHAFESSGDTEVVLKAYATWGVDMLVHLDGMFAFAIYDDTQKRLFAARDRAGEKPFFYAIHDGTLHFASELKSLISTGVVDRRINRNALVHYLSYGYVAGDECIFEGAHKLPPAHALTYSSSGRELKVWRYWDLPEPLSPESQGARTRAGSATDKLDELEKLLDDAVRSRMVADVPVGILLSGGMDSGIIAALAARHAARHAAGTQGEHGVRTFTVAFPGGGAFDESERAATIARAIGARHEQIDADPLSVDVLPALVRQFDEPIADPSMIPTYLVSCAVRQHTKVALGGEGGDELFGGYPHYNWLERAEMMRRGIPAPLRKMAMMVAASRPVGTSGRAHVMALGGSARDSLAAVNRYFDAPTISKLLATNGETAERERPEWRYSPAQSILQNATALDFTTYLPDELLVKVDRASMLTSLEVRCPMLAPSVIEFAFRLPDSLRATRTGRKILLRRLAQRLLPQLDWTGAKRGFSIPVDDWMRGDWKDDVELVLRDSIFGQIQVAQMVRNHQAGLNNGTRLFALMVFELWRREYGAEL